MVNVPINPSSPEQKAAEFVGLNSSAWEMARIQLAMNTKGMRPSTNIEDNRDAIPWFQGKDAQREAAMVQRRNAMFGHRGVQREPDYDMAGAIAAGIKPDERGHMPDTYKFPNHITFSDESKYHGKDGNEGGHWGGSEGNWTFTPGKTNLQYHSIQELKDYFKKYEPDVKLILPGE